MTSFNERLRAAMLSDAEAAENKRLRAAPATAPDDRVKELKAELAATEIAIAEYRQQCLDNATEIARLRSESEERLQNCAALVAENERLRAAPAQPERKHTEAEVQALLDAGEKLATMRYSDGEFEQYVRRILGVPKP